MYKIETHLHTNHVSQCARLKADHLAKRYYEGGFSAIAVTDHYNIETWKYRNINVKTNKKVMRTVLEGFYHMEEACAKYGIKVYKGLELRFYENDNDYLFYNFDDEMLEDADEIMALGIASFSKEFRKNGSLLIQAHPFRKPCVPVAPHLLDGIEVCNCNPRHNSRNFLALEFADLNPHLIRTAGSDCHQLGDECAAGIISETLPANDAEFVALLRSGKYELIKRY